MSCIPIPPGCVNVIDQQFCFNVDELMSIITILPPVYLRSDESKAIKHKLKINNTLADLTGWTIELYISGTLIKTITEISDDTVEGIIQNQITNTGEYEFVLLEADLALLAACKTVTLPAYVRYITPSITPPNIFSNVEFLIILTRA